MEWRVVVECAKESAALSRQTFVLLLLPTAEPVEHQVMSAESWAEVHR